MSDDWKVGDLAVCVSFTPWGDVPEIWEPQIERVYTVVGVDIAFDGRSVLDLDEDPEAFQADRAWDADDFRKIHPDELEPCEAEFVTLLNRTKAPVEMRP